MEKTSAQKFSKSVNDRDFYKVYLSIINGILRLTDKELNILAELMYQKNVDDLTKTFLTKEELSALLFGPENRKALQRRLNITQHNLNNYIKTLRGKKMLVEYENKLYINPKLFLRKENGKSVVVSFELVPSGD